MTCVYVLANYDEYGIDCYAATLDRAKLVPMVAEHWPHYETRAAERLMPLLARTDEDLLADKGRGFDLGEGWGGLTLYVIRLDAAPVFIEDKYK